MTRRNERVVADDEDQVLERRLVVVQNLGTCWLDEAINSQRPVKARGVGERFEFECLLGRFALEVEKALLSRSRPALVVYDGRPHQISQRRFLRSVHDFVLEALRFYQALTKCQLQDSLREIFSLNMVTRDKDQLGNIHLG